MSFVDENKNRADGGRRWGVESICQVLCEQGIAIAPATYYAAKSRTPSTRAVRDEQLKPVIAEVHEQNYGVYGARKMQAALRREKGIEIGRDQTARLMRELDIKGVRRGKPKPTTVADKTAPRPDDLVKREFKRQAARPAVGRRPDLHPHRTTAACTARSDSSHPPRRKPPTTLNHRHSPRAVPNESSLYRTQGGSMTRLIWRLPLRESRCRT